MKKELLLGFVYTISLAVSAQQKMEVSPKIWTEGSEVTLTYNPDMSALKGRDSIKAVMYCWKDYHWEAFDMPLRKSGSLLVSTFTVPKDVALLAWKYYVSDKVDVGDSEWEYASFVLDSEGRSMPSANIGWGFLRGQHTQEMAGIPTMRQVDFLKKDDEVVRMWINNELRDHPEQLPEVCWYASKFMAADTTAVNRRRIADNLKMALNMETKGECDEEFFLKALDVARNILHDEKLSEDIVLRIKERFPDGEYEREQAFRELFNRHEADEDGAAFEALLQRFPPEKFADAFVLDDMFDHYYSNLLRAYVYTPIIKRNDYDRVKFSLVFSPRILLATYFWHVFQIPYGRGDVTPEQIYPIATQIRNAILTKPRSVSELAYSPDEWREHLYKMNSLAWFDYAKLLDDVDKPAEAMALVDTLSVYMETKNAEFNDFRVRMLEKNGRSTEVLPVIRASLHDNAVSPAMIECLKKDYVKQNGSESGFDGYVNGLKSDELMNRQRREVLSNLVDVPVEYFSFESMRGGRLDMDSLKGKIIVMDFWATWCGPCKAAMPGMKMAMEKYEGDEDIVFLFVATMETDKDFREKIKSFIRSKGYDAFLVCYDAPTEKGKNEKAYSAYCAHFGISGIPMKMIIDRRGHARWVSNGYFGSPTALVDELSYVIDYLKNEE